jgi:hypothetical protein
MEGPTEQGPPSVEAVATANTVFKRRMVPIFCF